MPGYPEHTACLIRTYRFGPAEQKLAHRLSSVFGDAVYIVADVRRGPVDTAPLPSIEIDNRFLKEVGIFHRCNWGWRCGDHFYSAARQKLPNFKHFWLIENDVYFHVESLEDLFAPSAESNADIIAHRLTRRTPKWKPWFGSIRPHIDPVWGCRFSLTRLSARLIDAVTAERISISGRIAGAERKYWPNDEAICASVAHRDGFQKLELSKALGDICLNETFHGHDKGVYDREVLAATDPDDRIYHPVYDKERVIEWLFKMTKSRPERVDELLERYAYALSVDDTQHLRDLAAVSVSTPLAPREYL